MRHVFPLDFTRQIDVTRLIDRMDFEGNVTQNRPEKTVHRSISTNVIHPQVPS